MLNMTPKDFDVVTDAHPEEIRKLFGNSHLIGRRFRLAHIRFGREIIEVATFRASPAQEVETTASGRILRDNVYGTQEEDARRRDFTINAMYYDIRDFSVVDYVGGVDDINQRLLRIIGDPRQRYREDPVRMLRAMRFTAKLGFEIDAETAAPIRELGDLLQDVPSSRMFDEVVKLFHSGEAGKTLELLRRYGLFEHLFPQTAESLATADADTRLSLLQLAFRNTDDRIRQEKPVTPAFLFAALLWYPMLDRLSILMEQGQPRYQALYAASSRVTTEQTRYITIPRRFSGPMKEIWAFQHRFERRRGKQAFRLLERKRFRAAYDFLLLLAEIGQASQELADWWTRFQEVPQSERQTMVRALTPAGGKKKRKRRKEPV